MSKRKTPASVGEHERMVHALNARDAQSLFELCEEGHADLIAAGSYPLASAIRDGWTEGCKTLLLFNQNPEIIDFHIYRCWAELRPFEYAHVRTLWNEIKHTIISQLSNCIHMDLANIVISYLEPTTLLSIKKQKPQNETKKKR